MSQDESVTINLINSRRQSNFDEMDTFKIPESYQPLLSQPKLSQGNKPSMSLARSDYSSKFTFFERGAETSYKNSEAHCSNVHKSQLNYSKSNKSEYLISGQRNVKFESLTLLPEGLTSGEAQIRLKKYGKNKLKKLEDNLLQTIRNQSNAFSILLIAASVLSGVAASLTPFKASIIYLMIQSLCLFCIVIIAILISYRNQKQRQISTARYTQLINSNDVQVQRDGEIVCIDSELLVPGDVVYIRSNQKIPADLNLIVSENMIIDNQAITGEFQPIKLNTIINGENSKKTLYFGSTCIGGSGVGVVVDTGPNTFIGKLAEKSKYSDSIKKSRLSLEIDKFIRIECCIAILISILGFTYWMLIELDENEIPFAINYMVAIISATLPVTLPLIVQYSLNYAQKRFNKSNIILKDMQLIESLGNVSVLLIDCDSLVEQKKCHRFWKIWCDRQILDSNEIELQYTGIVMKQMFDAINLCTKEINNKRIPIFDLDQIEKVNPKNRIISTGIVEGCSIVIQETDNSLYSLTIIGSPDIIWSRCSQLNLSSGLTFNDFYVGQDFHHHLSLFYKNGHRAFLVAQGLVDIGDVQNIQINQLEDLICLGIIGFQVNVDISSQITIEKLKMAGIKTVLVSEDDQRLTYQIARQARLIQSEQYQGIIASTTSSESESISCVVVTGQELENLQGVQENENQMQQQLLWSCSFQELAFSKISPSQRITLINTFQTMGHIVASTAVRFQDAYTLQQADIGIALSNSNSLCKESAQMVLMKNDKSQVEYIASSIKLARNMTDNIKKQIWFSVSGKSGQIIPIVLMVVMGIPLPVTPLGILVIALLADVIPSIAIMGDPEDIQVFFRPPLRKNKPLISKFFYIRSYFITGIYATVSGLFCYSYMMYQLGFQVQSLYDIINKQAYTSQINQSNLSYDYDPRDPYLGNLNLKNPNISYICQDQDKKLDYYKKLQIPNPFLLFQFYRFTFESNDLRNSLVYCGNCSDLQTQNNPYLKNQSCWTTSFKQSFSDSCVQNQKRTDQDACFSIYSLDLAQRAFISGILLWSWSNLIISKPEGLSYRFQAYNPKLLASIFFCALLNMSLESLLYVNSDKKNYENIFILLGFPAMFNIIAMTLKFEVLKFIKRKWKINIKIGQI